MFAIKFRCGEVCFLQLTRRKHKDIELGTRNYGGKKQEVKKMDVDLENYNENIRFVLG